MSLCFIILGFIYIIWLFNIEATNQVMHKVCKVKVKLDKSSDVAGSSAPTSARWLFFPSSLARIKGVLVLTESQHVCVFAAAKLRFAPFISAGSWFWMRLTLAWILRAFSRQHLSQQSWIGRMGVDPYEHTHKYTQTHTLWSTFMLLLCLWAAGVSWWSWQEHWIWVVTTPCRTSSVPVIAGPTESREQIHWSRGEVSSVGGAKHPSSQSMEDGWESGTKQCCQDHHHLTLTWAHKASYVTEGQFCSITLLFC